MPSTATTRATIAGVLVLVVVAAGGAWLSRPGRPSSTAGASPDSLTVGPTSCATSWQAPTTNPTTYTISNVPVGASRPTIDVELVVSSTHAILAEIETLGPNTTRQLTVSFGHDTYNWQCTYAGLDTTSSPSIAVNPAGPVSTVTPLLPATDAELAPVLANYRSYTLSQVTTLRTQLSTLQGDIAAGNRDAAERDWLTAQLTFHSLGGAYGAFGDAGAQVDGLAEGLPGGVDDPDFVGLHRIEHDLWSGVAMDQIVDEADDLVNAGQALQTALEDSELGGTELATRAHEILEDTLRDTLTGKDDYGSGSGFAMARADLDATRYLLTLFAVPLRRRTPSLVPTATAEANVVQAALTAAGTTPVATAPLAVRQRVDGAVGQLLEILAPIPDLLDGVGE